jgi:hypothetical protein
MRLAHIYTLFASIAVAAALPVAAPAKGVEARGDDAIAYNQAYDYYVFAYDDPDVESRDIKKMKKVKKAKMVRRGDDAIAYNQAYDYYVFAYDDPDVESKKAKKE